VKSVRKVRCLKGELRVPSDKSISHRAVILPALAEGESYVQEWLLSKDTLATLNIIKV
jgi:3-phosphoshikimate 1-carboxyvinyltransferase